MDKKAKSELVAELKRTKQTIRQAQRRYKAIRLYLLRHNLIGHHEWGTVYPVKETRVSGYERRAYKALRVRLPVDTK